MPSFQPKLQPNGWWEQDRNGSRAEWHRAGEALAARTNSVYDRRTGSFTPKPKQELAGPRRDPKTGRFAKKRRNKVHHHPPKGR
jgi:hypothetical protein